MFEVEVLLLLLLPLRVLKAAAAAAAAAWVAAAAFAAALRSSLLALVGLVVFGPCQECPPLMDREVDWPLVV